VINTYNPATGEHLKQYSVMRSDEIIQALDIADEQFKHWRQLPLSNRCQFMSVLCDLLDKQQMEIAHLITLEMGKPLVQSIAEIKKCQKLCQYQMNHISEWLKPEIVSTEHSYSAIHYEPLGVLFAIMPWNYPFWQVFRFVISQVLAGNVVVFKHSPNVTGCALRLASLFEEAGFPQGVLTSLVIDVHQVEAIIHDHRVKGVTLTGSARAGRIVASQAGAALKKVSLELGGADACVVLDDADIQLSAQVSVQARMANAGQICIAPKRCIVMSNVYEKWLSYTLDHLKQYRCGNPLEMATTLGPLARQDLRHHLHQQITQSLSGGAELLLGGKVPDGRGFFYPPTLLTNVSPGLPAFDEELFGPVMSVVRAETKEEAFELANLSEYGLGAVIFTRDSELGRGMAISELEVGTCYVNTAVVSDLRLPIGGIKSSGMGRELSKSGLKEFLNTKVICVR